MFVDSIRLAGAGINTCQGTESNEGCEVGLALCVEARLVACYLPLK